MTFADDDLASVLIAPDREHTGYGQGVVVGFDQETFENTIEYRGTRLHDLPVLSGPDALTYQPGDIVLLMKWTPSGRGVSSYWIAGRPVVPAAGRAEEVVAFMRGELAKQIAAEVFAQRIHQVNDDGQVSTSSETPVELGGPVVEEADVSELGVAIVFISGLIHGTADSTETGVAGSMNVEISGATTVAADQRNRLAVTDAVIPAADNNLTVQQGATRAVVFTGLNPGLHTFTTVYAGGASSFGTANFSNRSLIVIAF